MSRRRAAHDVPGHPWLRRLERPLEREEEADLARRWQGSRDRNAADRLVRAEAGQVLATALQFRRYGVPISELVAEGSLGLVHALGKFDPERGIRLATYAAHWIRASILQHVVRSWSLVGGGTGGLRSRMFFKLRRERAAVTNVLGEGEAADREIARRVGTTPEKMREMAQRIAIRDVSLDTALPVGSSIRLCDRLPASDNQEQRLLESQVQAGAQDAVHRAVLELEPRERYIAQHRFLAEPGEEMSLADVGRHFGVSRERARQLESRTKDKLRARIPELGDRAVNEWITELVALSGSQKLGRPSLHAGREERCG
jgi:RNA polymerase sigma-32 factor